MTRASLVLLLTGLAFVAMFASWSAGGSFSSDCTTYSPTPTVTATPTPTPPWEPYARVPICNDTGQAVSDLHVRLVHPAANEDPIGANAPGCPEPAYFYGGSASSYSSISIDWGTPCVHPGEMVTLYFFAGCTTPEPGCSPPNVDCFYWTLDGGPVPAASPAPNPRTCEGPSPIVTATPQPAGPCPARGTPPVTYPPTPTPATPTPTPGPTGRDMVLMVTIPFCNDAGESASDLHAHFAFPYSGRTFKGNPSGCPEPSFEPAHYGLDTFDLDVDWGVACVDPGESLTIEFTYACGDVPCNTPQPFCFTWTRFGEPLYQGEGDCPPPTPTPTPAPALKGDVDCDGDVDSADALLVLRDEAGLSHSAECINMGDADCDGHRDSIDALFILRHVAGLPYSLPPDCSPVGSPPSSTPAAAPSPS